MKGKFLDNGLPSYKRIQVYAESYNEQKFKQTWNLKGLIFFNQRIQ